MSQSNNQRFHVGIAGTGVYIPEYRMTAAQLSAATNNQWSEDAIIQKLGIIEKSMPGPGDGTQEMGVKAALDCLKNAQTPASEIDLILSIGEEWKEYPLTTTGIYIQEKIGATNAWALDIQQRCCTSVAALKIAKDMMFADDDLKTVLIAGGYRNGDFLDYTDTAVSFMYNLAAGAGAILLKKNLGRNELLGTHIITDGTMAHDVVVEFGGTAKPITCENIHEAHRSLRVVDEKHMKDRLNEVSMNNWMTCINKAYEKSGMKKSDMDFLVALHFKRSLYFGLLTELGLNPNQTIYLENYGHIGQIDQILSLHLAQQTGKISEGSVISMIAAGIGYAWGANVIRWGKI